MPLLTLPSTMVISSNLGREDNRVTFHGASKSNGIHNQEVKHSPGHVQGPVHRAEENSSKEEPETNHADSRDLTDKETTVKDQCERNEGTREEREKNGVRTLRRERIQKDEQAPSKVTPDHRGLAQPLEHARSQSREHLNDVNETGHEGVDRIPTEDDAPNPTRKERIPWWNIKEEIQRPFSDDSTTHQSGSCHSVAEYNTTDDQRASARSSVPREKGVTEARGSVPRENGVIEARGSVPRENGVIEEQQVSSTSSHHPQSSGAEHESPGTKPSSAVPPAGAGTLHARTTTTKTHQDSAHHSRDSYESGSHQQRKQTKPDSNGDAVCRPSSSIFSIDFLLGGSSAQQESEAEQGGDKHDPLFVTGKTSDEDGNGDRNQIEAKSAESESESSSTDELFKDLKRGTSQEKTKDACPVGPTDEGDNGAGKKKMKRTHYSKNDLRRLNEHFARNPWLSPEKQERLAKEMGYSEVQIKTWFQNRRASVFGTRKPKRFQTYPELQRMEELRRLREGDFEDQPKDNGYMARNVAGDKQMYLKGRFQPESSSIPSRIPDVRMSHALLQHTFPRLPSPALNSEFSPRDLRQFQRTSRPILYEPIVRPPPLPFPIQGVIPGTFQRGRPSMTSIGYPSMSVSDPHPPIPHNTRGTSPSPALQATGQPLQLDLHRTGQIGHLARISDMAATEERFHHFGRRSPSIDYRVPLEVSPTLFTNGMYTAASPYRQFTETPSPTHLPPMESFLASTTERERISGAFRFAGQPDYLSTAYSNLVSPYPPPPAMNLLWNFLFPSSSSLLQGFQASSTRAHDHAQHPEPQQTNSSTGMAQPAAQSPPPESLLSPDGFSHSEHVQMDLRDSGQREKS